MLSLKALQTCPTQKKYFLIELDVFYPLDDHMITFNSDQFKPFKIPPFVAFQNPVSINQFTIHRCIIDEGKSTCIMYAYV
jgi:hypothetical protein